MRHARWRHLYVIHNILSRYKYIRGAPPDNTRRRRRSSSKYNNIIVCGEHVRRQRRSVSRGVSLVPNRPFLRSRTTRFCGWKNWNVFFFLFLQKFLDHWSYNVYASDYAARRITICIIRKTPDSIMLIVYLLLVLCTGRLIDSEKGKPVIRV